MTPGFKTAVDGEVAKLKAYDAELEKLMTLCREADVAKEELRNRIDTLEGKLDDGSCTESLTENMGKELQEYKKLLEYDFTKLGQEMKSEVTRYIQVTVAPLEAIKGYGKSTGTNVIMLSFSELENVLEINGFEIDLNVNTALYQGVQDKLKTIANSVVDVYPRPQSSFPAFNNARMTFGSSNEKKVAAISETHAACYKLLGELDSIGVEGEKSDDEEGEKSTVKDVFKNRKTLWDGLTDYDASPGANSYTKPSGYSGASFSTQG